MKPLIHTKPQNKSRWRRGYIKYKQHKYILGHKTLMVQGYEPQALDYLLTQGFSPSQINCEVEGNVPEIIYKYRGRSRRYIPDMFIEQENLIIEVKSVATLGLTHKKRRGWSMTCAKAAACHRQGYKFALLLMSQDGQRIKMPKNWAKMKKDEVKIWVEQNGGYQTKKALL